MRSPDRPTEALWTDSLLEQLAELDHLYRTAPVGLCLLDRELRFLRVNRRLADMNGKPVSKHIGQTLRQMLPEMAPTLEPMLHQVIATGEPVLHVEVHGTTAAQPGVPRDWLNNYYPLMSEHGRVRGISVVIQEVTDLKRAEAALQEAHDHLEKRVMERTRELTEANARLLAEIAERKRAEEEAHRHREELAHVARVATLGELAASLAHEINQPLSAILSNAQAAQRFLRGEPPDLDEVRDALIGIIAADMRAAEVIRRLRTLLRKGQSDRTLLDVNDLVHEVSALVESDMAAKKVSIRLDLVDDVPPVLADRIQLQQVVLNMLLNGSEAMIDEEESSRVLIVRTSKDDAGAIQVAVRDSGVGIERKNVDRLFDAFFTTKETGLGMGLSISRTIIEAHNGDLWATQNSDRGATFHFSLPTVQESSE